MTETWLRRAAAVGRGFHWTVGPAWAHNTINAGFLLADLAVVAVTVAAAIRWPWLAFVPVYGAVLGAAFFLLLAVGVHEASHGTLFVTRHPKARLRWNRAIGWALSVPFAVHYSRHWEEGHRLHHRRPLTPEDPQRFNVDTGAALARTVALQLGVPLYSFVHRYMDGGGRGRSSPAVMAAFVGFWAGVLGLAAWWGGAALVLSLVWGLQVVSAINQVKGALEHGDLGDRADLRLRSRTFAVLWWAVPFWVTVFHFEHHLCDQVPWYRLRAFHRAIVDPSAAGVWRDDPLTALRGRSA